MQIKAPGIVMSIVAGVIIAFVADTTGEIFKMLVAYSLGAIIFTTISHIDHLQNN